MDQTQSAHDLSVAASRAVPGATRQPSEDLFRYVTAYAHERPDVVALWAFGIGFVLGLRFRFW